MDVWTSVVTSRKCVQVLLHLIISLAKYKQSGMYSMEADKPHWIWGIAATVCVVTLCFASGLYIRNNHYEVFLLTHIALSVVTVAKHELSGRRSESRFLDRRLFATMRRLR
jgi:hypothetical protein